MAKIRIEPDNVINASFTAKAAEQITGNVARGIESIKWRIDGKIRVRGNIFTRLRNLQNLTGQIEREINDIYHTVNQGANMYMAAEQKILGAGREITGTKLAMGGRAAIEACFKGTSSQGNQMVQEIGNELVFDQNQMYQYLKKDAGTVTVEERAMLMEVILKLRDTADKMQASGGGADNQYHKMYISLLNYISEQGKDSSSIAGSLLKICQGEKSLDILGIEVSEEVGKVFGEISIAAYGAEYKSKYVDEYLLKAEGSISDKLKFSMKFDEPKDSIHDKLTDSGKHVEIDRKSQYWDEDGNTIHNPDVDFYKKKVTLAEQKKEAKASISIYEGAFDFEEWGDLNVTVGNAEAHANIAGGLYVVGANGEKKFSPGVNAEIGASVTAVEVKWENQLAGDKNLGLNADAGVTVGKAEAKADIGAQIYGEDGELNLQLGASAKAEAIAAEAEGSIGVNILGGEVGVKGSVNFGVGAHADIGYKNGVFKFDIGASLGVGVSLGAEVDIGGMVNTVCDTARAAWDFLWGKR